MSSPYTAHKQNAIFGVLLGVVLILSPLYLRQPPASLSFVIAGVWFASRSFKRLVHIWALEQSLSSSHSREEFFNHYSRATLPRQIFWLLLAVAEIDGEADAREKEVVRRFVLERFTDPISSADLKSWEAERIPPEQVGPLASNLRQLLSRSERETVFFWCCLVALIDRRFQKSEHDALQDIAQGLDFPQYHARRIFLHAKAQVMVEDARWSDGSTGETPFTGQTGRRGRALEILGLGEDASADQIRKAHRELVKRYHPDAHSHLGPVAAEEAATRFREIQEAYELLSV